MNIEEALEEFNFFNEGDYITKNMSIAKDIVLTAYEKEKEKNKELEKQLQSTYQKQYINDLEAINHSNVSFN